MKVHAPPPNADQHSGLSQNSTPERQKRGTRSAAAGGLALAVLIAIYAFAQPVLNEQLGWQLPRIEQFANDGGAATIENADTKSAASPAPVEPAPIVNVRPEEPTKSTPSAVTDASIDDSLLHGLLVDQGNDRFLSPAGLMYVPGSQEGHRLKHVERHTIDDPGRPGSHGVFDGGMKGALATIDKAYQKAKTGAQTSKQEDDGRIIYTVDLGARVGFVGGIDGRRRNNPMARRVRLVLEQSRVITAYPM